MPKTLSPHATWAYSWIKPPSRRDAHLQTRTRGPMQVQHWLPIRIADLGMPDSRAVGQPDAKISPHHRPPSFRVSAQAASELTCDEQAGATLAAMAHAIALVQPAGCGWYRYHTLFAEVLRLKLRREYPGRIAALHRRAARWYERNGALSRRGAACQAGRRLAARRQHGHRRPGDQRDHRPAGQPVPGRRVPGMPYSQVWTEVQPCRVCAAARVARWPVSTPSSPTIRAASPAARSTTQSRIRGWLVTSRDVDPRRYLR